MSTVLLYCQLLIGPLALVVSMLQFWKFTLPGLRETHRFRQETRLKWDGIEPPWFMCWAYWFGVERWFWGHKMYDKDDRMDAYLRGEFD